MARSTAQEVKVYLSELPDDRRENVKAVRELILNHLPAGYEEIMQHGMISYVVPLERYPKTYNKLPLVYASLASQKNYMSLYLMGVYADPQTEKWFTKSYKETGKRLDMGKSCVRFKGIEDLPMELIGEAVARTTVDEFIGLYEASRNLGKGSRTRKY